MNSCVMQMVKLNKKKKTKLSKNILLTLIFCSLLFLSVQSLGVSVSNIYGSVMDKQENRIINLTQYTQGYGFNPITDDIVYSVKSIPNVVGVNNIFNYDMPSEECDTQITMNGISFNTFWLQGASVNGGCFYQKNILNYFDGDLKSPIMCGREFLPTDSKCAVIDEAYAYIFGYNNLEDILNQTISVSFDGETSVDLKIVGVYYHNMYYTNGKESKDDSLMQDIRKDLDNNSFENRQRYIDNSVKWGGIVSGIIVVSSDVFLNIPEYQKMLQGEFDLRSEQRISNFCEIVAESSYDVPQICDELDKITNNRYQSSVNDIKDIMDTLNAIQVAFNILSTVILVVSLVGIGNFVYVRVNEQEKLTRLMLKMGYEHKSIKWIYLLEIMYLCGLAMGISAVLMFFITIMLDMFLSPVYSQICEYEKYALIVNPVLLLCYCVAVSLIVFGISYIFVTRQLKHNKIRLEN